MTATLDTSNRVVPAPGWPLVILSKDFAIGRQVGALVQRELSMTDPRVSVESRVWLFSSLKQPSLLRLAVLQALTAHLVVLCPYAYRPLPGGVKAFLRDWMHQINGRVTPLLLSSTQSHSADNAGIVGAGSGPDGGPRVPVYLNLSAAVSAARELARLRAPEVAPAVCFENTWTDEALSPEGELVS